MRNARKRNGVSGVTTDIQIRGVPEDTKKELKRRAAQEGLSVSSYVLRLIKRELTIPSRADFAASMALREPFELGRPAAEILEEVRRGEDS